MFSTSGYTRHSLLHGVFSMSGYTRHSLLHGVCFLRVVILDILVDGGVAETHTTYSRWQRGRGGRERGRGGREGGEGERGIRRERKRGCLSILKCHFKKRRRCCATCLAAS